jgi:GT2 family glycosyltransferase
MLGEPHTGLDVIDIVIPVYRGEAETRTCLESVLAARVRNPCEVVVIDDASPEPSLAAWLRELAGSGRITLIVHEINRGFVASVNEGMELHPDRDVVLLNSDTEVADGWIDRLAAHPRHDPAIGTVTPFSTNATICSYPRTLADNALPRGETTARLDATFAAANPGHCIDIPTAVGFCMYITRRCLEKVGSFDAERYGAGYGEEVDFCMRAARAGFRNVLAADVFVRHVGEVSFGDAGSGRRLQAQAIVDSLYPEFQPRLRNYLAADPARDARRRADLERLRRSPRPRVVFATGAAADAGLARAHEFAATLDDDTELLLLQAHAGSHVVLTWIGREEELALWFDATRDADTLGALLDGIGISSIRLDAVQPPPRALQDLPSRLKRRRNDPVLSTAPLPHLRSAHLRAPDPAAIHEAPRRLTAPLRALARMLGRRG